MMRYLANVHYLTSPVGSIYRTSCLAGPVAPTGKTIIHWIGCINIIKMSNNKLIIINRLLLLFFLLIYLNSAIKRHD